MSSEAGEEEETGGAASAETGGEADFGSSGESGESGPLADKAAFETLLEFLRDKGAFDYDGYKRGTLRRRIARRMHDVGCATYPAYREILRADPRELPALFNTILINVTSFFRDPSAWEYLAREIVPNLVARAGDRPIRAWSAGCATGQEAFTLAIVLAEALGVDRFARLVKIYATDIDEEALAEARQAVFTAKDVEGVSPPLLERYFEGTGSKYVFRRDLRRGVIFGRNDLIQDAPISRIDLLVCRNTLMYFSPKTQQKIAKRLQFALVEGGYVFTGKAEMLLAQSGLFRALDLKHRVFEAVGTRKVREPLPGLGSSRSAPLPPSAGQLELQEASFDAAPMGQLLVDANGMLVRANGRARALFGISAADLGRPLHEHEVSYRPADLRSGIDRVRAEGRPVMLRDVTMGAPDAEAASFDVHLTPLSSGGSPLGVHIGFFETTHGRKLEGALRNANRDLEASYDELQAAGEALETTNEELQSTVEELQTTNEELQSSNEELETTNEELHSSNDELQFLNDEVRRTGLALGHSNLFLRTILASLRVGVIVVDRELSIQIWNRECEDQWGLRQDEVLGKNLLALDMGVSLEEIRAPMAALLGGARATQEQEIVLSARDRRGRSFECKVTCSPLEDESAGRVGLVVWIEDVNKLRKSRDSR